MKKDKDLRIALIIVAVFIIIIAGATSGTNKTDNDENKNNKSEQTVIDKSYIVYQDANFLVKIIDYKYNNITDSITVNFYMENNSDKDTTFNINGNISIDGIMIDGGSLYKVVKSQSKANKEMLLYNLKKNNIDGKTCSNMKFNLDIYQSENYIINNRILNNQEFTYYFKR